MHTLIYNVHKLLVHHISSQNEHIYTIIIFTITKHLYIIPNTFIAFKS